MSFEAVPSRNRFDNSPVSLPHCTLHFNNNAEGLMLLLKSLGVALQPFAWAARGLATPSSPTSLALRPAQRTNQRLLLSTIPAVIQLPKKQHPQLRMCKTVGEINSSLRRALAR